jgi:hypothetical protein
MAQTTVLAAGTTDATSSAIVVPAGATVTVSLFSAAEIPLSCTMDIILSAPSGDQIVGALTKYDPSVGIYAPGTFYVVRAGRNMSGVNVGAFIES